MNTAVAAKAPLEITRMIDATVAETWRAWVEPELMARWFAPGSMRADVQKLDVRKGGEYRIRMQDESDEPHTVFGRFIEVVPEQRLVMSWAWEGNETEVSNVTVRFTARNDATELHIVHDGLPDADSMARHGEGWQGCLEKLEAGVSQFS